MKGFLEMGGMDEKRAEYGSPFDLEKEIWHSVYDGIREAVKAKLSGTYNNPLEKVIANVIAAKQDKIEQIINESVEKALTGDLRERLIDALAHKLSKVLISKSEGEIEKVANTLRSNPEFRAKLTLAIANCVKEIAAQR